MGFFFFLPHVACRILVPQLGIELALSMTVLSPDHWIAMEFPSEFYLLGILLRTVAWETAFQITVRNCSKEVR